MTRRCIQHDCAAFRPEGPRRPSQLGAQVGTQKEIFGAIDVVVITGFLEKGETPENGVLREVTEELGLIGTSAELIGIYTFEQMNQVIIAYHVKAEGDIVLGEELLEIKMVEKSRLKGWSFGTGLAVTDWVKKYQQK